MNRKELILYNLYGVDLIGGRLSPIPSHAFVCFLSVNQQAEPKWIRKQLLQLLVAGCAGLTFFGREQAIWLQEAQRLRNLLRQTRETSLECADSMDDFCAAILLQVRVRYFVPTDFYLLYDDTSAYQAICRRLKQGGEGYVSGDATV